MYNSPMPSVPEILSMRRKRRLGRSTLLSRGGLGCGGLASLGAALLAAFAAFAYISLSQGLPPPEQLAALLEPPGGLLRQPTRVYDRTGENLLLALQNPAASQAGYLVWDTTQRQHLPPVLGLATVAVNDPGFWEHTGYSLAGVRMGSHPTLAQRLVTELLLWEEAPGVRRALRERLLAAQVTRLYGREKVLEWYLNSAYYGNLAYGVDAAARLYLGKPGTGLTLAEAALLAAVAEAPALNPIDTPEAARTRQLEVLNRLREQGLINSPEFREARQERPAFSPPGPLAPEPLTEFTNLVRAQLYERFGRSRVELGGLRVVTSLDYALQLQVDCARRAQLAGPGNLERESLAADGSPCEAARLLPTRGLQTGNPPGKATASAVVIDPTTGELLALAGDALEELEPGQTPWRPSGSLLAPFVHLTAYTRGFNPASLVWDIPSSVPAGLVGDEALPQNYRGPMRLRTALNNDYLVPTLQVLDQMGPENVWRTARQLGLASLQLPEGEAAFRLLLDSGQVSLLELTHAYGAFGQAGVLAGQPAYGANGSGGPDLAPVVLKRVEEYGGRVWLESGTTSTRPVISPQLAFLLTNVLSDEVSRWQSLGHPNPLEIGRPVAAKASRLPDGGDAWTVGYTPHLAVGVWAGLPTEPGSEGLPLDVAAGLWHAILQYASRELPPEGWPAPPGLSFVEVCDPSGMLPTADCPALVAEVFLNGNEPLQPDNLYARLQVNRETGRLATVFTPPELVEEQVYLMVPPEAEAWASEAGLPTPPDSYDLIYTPPGGDSQVAIQTPAMFAYISGEVPVTGSAGGEGFEFYRLQVGQGLNPQAWTQLGEEGRSPVSNGSLGLWDAAELGGLFALRLQVVRADQRVDTATIQVTVDNTPPEISILYPEEGQRVESQAEGVVTLQLQASDDLALERVEVTVDNRTVATLSAPPFAVSWPSTPGSHILVARAFDLAGNTSRARTEFEVRGN
jgi:membrane peptidoglycan carboxypeptidase